MFDQNIISLFSQKIESWILAKVWKLSSIQYFLLLWFYDF